MRQRAWVLLDGDKPEYILHASSYEMVEEYLAARVADAEWDEQWHIKRPEQLTLTEQMKCAYINTIDLDRILRAGRKSLGLEVTSAEG